jgi:ParB family transcriptional regulator, chromosome partitioning protein
VAKQKFGLGRGLDALITGAKDVMAPQQPLSIDEHSILEAAIDSIIPNPRQPRRAFREDDPKLLELSASIKEHGLLQPLIVTRLDTPTPGMVPGTTGEPMATGSDSWFAENDQATPTIHDRVGAGDPVWGTGNAPALGVPNVVQFQIIAGERRWRAARLAGLTKVPVIIKEATPQEMLELALIENIQRADLNPIEEALAYQTLIQEFGLTQEMVAKQVGKDRSTITNSIRLLQLSSRVREALINQPERFSEGHARALIGISREEDQIAAMGKIISERLNVRQAEELATRIKATERATTIAEHATPYGRDGAELAERISNLRPRSPDLDELETQFRNALTVKVDLKCNTKGKGTLVLHFNNQDELERLYHKLCENPPNE